MSFFDGSTSSKKRDVNLGGKSLKKSGAVVETKEQLAERNALARLQREHQRAENSAALCISLSWRVHRARSVAIARIKEVVQVALNDSLHSASALSPNELGPPAQPILDQSIRSLIQCMNTFMFLRKDSNRKLRMAFAAQYQLILDALSSNLSAVFASDDVSGAQIEVVTAILNSVTVFELSRALRAVGSELLLSAIRDNSCPLAAAALKLLSVPLWACLNRGDASAAPSMSHVAHHAAVTVLLCASGAEAVHVSSSVVQLLVSSCVTSTHAVQTAARSPALQSAEVSNLNKAVLDAWRSGLLRAPRLLHSCPSVFHPQHAHSQHVWSLLLQSMLSSPAALSSAALANIMSISAVFKELKLTCQLVASLPGGSHELITRDVIAMFLREVCPDTIHRGDLSTNAAAFSSWLRGLSPAQLDSNQEMTRLMCNAVAPILRAAPFPLALPILNLCAFETPMPALFMAQNGVLASYYTGTCVFTYTQLPL